MARDPVISYTFDNVADTNVPNVGSDATRNGVIDGDVTINSSDPAGAGTGSYATFNGGSIVVGDPNAAPGAARSNWLHPLLNQGNATLAAYVRTTQVGDASGNAWQSPGITGAEQSGAGDDGFWGNLNPQGQMRVQMGDGAQSLTTPINDGAWHLVVFTRDVNTGQQRTYVDGKLTSQVTGDKGAKGANFDRIGGTTYVANDNTTVQSTFLAYNGDLDQLEIFNRVLSPSEIAQFYGPAAGSAPATPTNVTHTEDVIKAVRITFNDSTGALGYSIRRATSAGGPFTEIAAVTADDTTPTETYLDTGLTAGTQYFYQVVAFNSAGESAPAAFSATPAASGSGHTAFFYNTGFWGSGGRTNSGTTPDGLRVTAPPTIVTTVGGPVDVSWGGNAPVPPFTGVTQVDNFSTIFTGTLHITEAGTYSFRSNTDDDGALFVAGVAVGVDLGVGHGEQLSPNNTDIDLVPGDYPFIQFQAEQGGGAGVHSLWITPSEAAAGDTTYSPIPVDNLRSVVVAPAAPTTLTADYDGATAVTLNFKDNSTSELRYQVERSFNGGAFQVIRQAGIIQNPDNGTGASTAGDPADGSIADAVALNGTYKYRVVAINYDSAGKEQRGVSNEVTVNVTGASVEGPGAQGYYYNADYWGTGVAPADNFPIVLDNFDATETVTNVNFDYGANGPGGSVRADNFSTAFTAKLTIPADAFPTGQTSGTFTILGQGDDDTYVYVNGTLVSSDPGGHGIRDPRTVGGNAKVVPITLTAGQQVNLLALQHEGGGGAGIQLRWITPANNTPQPLPDSVFTSNIPNGPGGTATGAPSNPGAPTISSQELGATFAIVRWADNATNENRYVVERSTSADFTQNLVSTTVPINSTSFTDTAVTVGQTYFYRVRAENFNGTSASVATAAGTTIPAVSPAPDAAPTKVVVSNRNAGVLVTFTDATISETDFVVERAPASDPTNFTPLAAAAGTGNATTAAGVSGGVISYVDTTAVAGQSYIYRVRARNAGGTGPASAASSAITFTAPGGTGLSTSFFNNTTLPGAGESFSDDPAETEVGGVDRNFGSAAPAAGVNADFSTLLQGEVLAQFSETYTFYLDSDDGITLKLIDPANGAVLINYSNIGARRGVVNGFPDTAGSAALQAGKRYLIQVTHVDTGGGAAYQVGWASASVPQDIIPSDLLFPLAAGTTNAAPSNVQAVRSVDDTKVTVSFTDNSTVETGFELLRSTNPNGPFTVVESAPSARVLNGKITIVDPDTLTAGTTYYYQVHATGEPNSANAPVPALAVPSVNTPSTNTINGGSATSTADPDANPATTGTGVQLTSTVGQTGTVYTTSLQSVANPTAPKVIPGSTGTVNGFSAQFDFRVRGASGRADGFAFVLQRNDPLIQGGGGGGLGYQGLLNALAIKFDIYPNLNQTGLYANGVVDDAGDNIVDTAGNAMDIASGTYRVFVEYDSAAKTLTLQVSGLDASGNPDATRTFTKVYDAVTAGDVAGADGLDVSTIIGGSSAFVGFSGGTGGEGADQRVYNFKFNGQDIPLGADATPSGAQITGAYVRGANWSTTFRNFLATQSGQDSSAGFKVTGFNASSPILSFSNLDTLAVKFNGNVPPSLAAGSVTITSAGGRTYTVASVTPDPTDPTIALVKLSTPIVNDRVTIALAGVSTADGSPAQVTLNVLPADVNQSGGAVNAADLVLTRNRIGRTTANPGTGATAYSVFNDVNGDGLINASDLVLVRNNVGKSLPAAPALVFSGSRIAPASRDRDLLDELK